MDKIEQLTRLNVEIEGLLRVLSNRDNADARQILGEKFNTFSLLFSQLMADGKLDDATAKTEEKVLEQAAGELTQDEVKDQEAVSSEVEDETDAADSAIEREEEEHPVRAAGQTVKVFETEDDGQSEAGDLTLGDKLSDDKQDDMRVDEMIARQSSTDLIKSFTLNDKIGFYRTLFAQDTQAFGKVVNDLSALPTYQDATDYLVDNLGWDLSNPNVEEFLSIIRPHYPKVD